MAQASVTPLCLGCYLSRLMVAAVTVAICLALRFQLHREQQTYFLQSAFLVTSVPTAMLRMPLLRSSSVTTCAFFRLMSTTATEVPASPRACANALPMPCPAPVAKSRQAFQARKYDVAFGVTKAIQQDEMNPGIQKQQCPALMECAP